MNVPLRKELVRYASKLLEQKVQPGELAREMRRIADDLERGLRDVIRDVKATSRPYSSQEK